MLEEDQSRLSAKPDHPFGEVSLERAIGLRWVLRDIQAGRLKLSPVRPADLRLLIDEELVEMRGDDPVLTDAGRTGLDW
jgi:hypothetical protein